VPALRATVVLIAVWASLVGLLVAAGELITRSAAVTGFDHAATRDVVSARTATLDSVMKAVTWLGSWVALVVAAAVIAFLVLSRRLPAAAAVVAVAAWAGEALGVRIAKDTVARERPPRAIWLMTAHGWSFPSGHTATAALAFTALALCVAALARRRLLRVLGWLVAGLAVAATGFSRVELGVHWVTDVIASVVFVSAWLAAIVIIAGGRLRPPKE
jgi:undecaprenyl-diphosphatase